MQNPSQISYNFTKMFQKSSMNKQNSRIEIHQRSILSDFTLHHSKSSTFSSRASILSNLILFSPNSKSWNLQGWNLNMNRAKLYQHQNTWKSDGGDWHLEWNSLFLPQKVCIWKLGEGVDCERWQDEARRILMGEFHCFHHQKSLFATKFKIQKFAGNTS